LRVADHGLFLEIAHNAMRGAQAKR
jgi:hypothetical protein